MRTYHSSSNDKKRGGKFFKKNMYIIILSVSVVAIALTVTLSLVLTRPKTPTPPVIAPNQVQFNMPLESYTLGKGASLKSLVYSATLKQWRTHNGTDFTAAVGSSVYAVAEGTVDKVTNTNLEGYIVTVKHNDGYKSVYKSLAKNVAVKEGDKISANAKIGEIGTTMAIEAADGNHLHLEILKDGKLIDPMTVLPANENK